MKKLPWIGFIGLMLIYISYFFQSSMVIDNLGLFNSGILVLNFLCISLILFAYLRKSDGVFKMPILIMAFVSIGLILIMDAFENYEFLYQGKLLVLLLMVSSVHLIYLITEKIRFREQLRTDMEADNKYLKVLNDLIVGLSQLDNLQKLEEEDFVKQIFRIFYSVQKKADYGSVYLLKENKVKFIDAIGHNLTVLNKESYRIKDYVFPEDQVAMVKNINKDFLEVLPSEYHNEIKQAKESIVLTIQDEGEIYGAISLDIGVDSKESFNEEDLIVSESVAKISNTYYKNIRVRKKAYKHMSEEKQALIHQTTIDDLTGLHNKRYFFETYQQVYEDFIKTQKPLSIILMDIDNYKDYNDAFGHLPGDACLQRVAQAFKNQIRETDLIARYGGEEFIILLENHNAEEAYLVGEKLRKTVYNLNIDNFVDGEKKTLTISIGVSSAIPTRQLNPVALINSADHALYQSKHQGKNMTTIAKENKGWNNGSMD